jgi:regulator of replication initiation timing
MAATTKTEWILELKDLMSRKLDSVDDEVNKLQRDFGELIEEVKDLDHEQMKGLKKGLNDNQKAATSLSDVYGDLMSNIASGDVEAATLGVQGLSGGLMGAVKAAWAFAATPVGMVLAALGGVAYLAGEFAEYNNEAIKANKVIGAITKTVGEQTSVIRARGQAMADTFGGDNVEHIRRVTDLQKAWQMSFEEAFNAYEYGMIRGGHANEEFTDTIREYPQLFKQYGFSAKEFIDVINTGADLGIWSDKLPDAMKEFGLAVTEQTDTARSAMLNAFGSQFTDRLFNDVKTGAITVREALGEVSAKAAMSNLNQQQQAQLTADLFKGAGEDAGGALMIMDAFNQSINQQERELTALEQRLSQVTDQNERLEEAQREALESDAYKTLAQDASDAWTSIQIRWYKTVEFVTEGIGSIVTGISGMVSGAVAGFMHFGTSISTYFGNVKDELMDLVSAFMSAGDIWTAFTNDGIGAAADAASGWWDNLKKEAGEAGDALDVKANIIDPTLSVATQGYADGVAKELADAEEKARPYDAEALMKEEQNTESAGLVGGGGTGGGGSALGIGNGGSGRVLNMNLEVKNYFNTGNSKQADVHSMADQIVGIIVDRLRDGALAVA